MAVKQFADAVLVSRVNKCVEFINDEGFHMREEQLVAISPVLHALEGANGAVETSQELC